MTEKILELGLFKRRKNGDEKAGPAVVNLLDRILDMIGDTVIEDESLKTVAFRESLTAYRKQFVEMDDLEEIGALADECLAACQDYLQRGQSFLREREEKLGEVIDLLRQALSEIAGQSVKFNSRLIASSERFDKMIRIQDIQELKKQITTEVQQLRQAVLERQKQEAEGYSKLSGRIASLQQKLNQTRKEASVDSLTGAANRRCFDETLKKWVEECTNGESFILAMFDLDDFKRINDMHGHAVGDLVLQCAGKWLGKDIRPHDFLARFGGDEFAVLLSGIALDAAETRFAGLIKRIGAAQFEFRKGRDLYQMPFSLSCGLTAFSAGDTPETIFYRADEALYEAKKKGKSKVVAKTPPPVS